MPTAPRNLMHTKPVFNGNMFNITLTWSRPDPPNGIITQYNVSYITNSCCLIIFLLSQVSYISTNSRNFSIQKTNISDSINASYTWINLVRGQYNFIVVPFTNTGPGVANSVDVSTFSSKLINNM